MLAMQYRFVLPADYDMTIIKRRINDHGHKMDFRVSCLKPGFMPANPTARHTVKKTAMRHFICGRTQKACTVFCPGPVLKNLPRTSAGHRCTPFRSYRLT